MKKSVLLLVVVSLSVLAASDYRYSNPGVKPVKNELYKSECASCHFGYQPGLLPKRSWKKIMDNLENHFGTDAYLDDDTSKSILEYLVKNSADNSMGYKRSKKINNSISSHQTPIAVSDTPYFLKEHRGIPQRLIKQKEVGSISNCMACHTQAENGLYGERYINIPNWGRWDD
jgi:hypothetical protein